MSYLPKGLPEPVPEIDKLDLPYWEGTRQGRLLENGSPDDLIRGSSRDPSLFGAADGAGPELEDSEPPEGAVQEEDEPAMA